jgi:hypothetical protein
MGVQGAVAALLQRERSEGPRVAELQGAGSETEGWEVEGWGAEGAAREPRREQAVARRWLVVVGCRAVGALSAVLEARAAEMAEALRGAARAWAGP